MEILSAINSYLLVRFHIPLNNHCDDSFVRFATHKKMCSRINPHSRNVLFNFLALRVIDTLIHPRGHSRKDICVRCAENKYFLNRDNFPSY